MKKLLWTAVAGSLLLTACSNEEKGNKEVKEVNIESKQNTTEESTEKPASSQKQSEKNEAATEEKEPKTSVASKKSDQTKAEYSFLKENGQVNFEDPAFREYYFFQPHVEEFADIKAGMTRQQVEAIYGSPTGQAGINQAGETADRYGDIAVQYFNDEVVQVALAPDEKISVERARQLFPNPTIDMIAERAKGPVPASQPSFTYNETQGNGFMVWIKFSDDNGYIDFIHNVAETGASSQATSTEESAGTSQSNGEELTLPGDIKYSMEDSKEEQLRLLDVASRALDNIDEGIEIEKNKTLAWNALIKAPVPGYWNKYDDVRVKALEQMNRGTQYFENMSDYKRTYE